MIRRMNCKTHHSKKDTNLFFLLLNITILLLYLSSFSYIFILSLFSLIWFDCTVQVVASRQLCTGSKHLKEANKTIIERDGEGIILRQVGSVYERERSNSLVKVKVLIIILLFFSSLLYPFSSFSFSLFSLFSLFLSFSISFFYIYNKL